MYRGAAALNLPLGCEQMLTLRALRTRKELTLEGQSAQQVIHASPGGVRGSLSKQLKTEKYKPPPRASGGLMLGIPHAMRA